MSEYRDCPRCEKLKDENQKISQSLADAKTKLSKVWRLNMKAALVAACVIGGSVLAGFSGYSKASKPPPPEKPEPCLESAEVISSDDSMRRCSPGAKLTVTPLQVADKVLVRCECGTSATKDAGQ